VPELPDAPNLDWLRKHAKQRLEALRNTDPAAQLSDAQFAIAKEYGFASWRALKAHIDALSVDGRLIDAAKSGDVATLAALLDRHPEKLHLKTPPYGGTLLHAAADHPGAVDLLLTRGMDPNAREGGDNTYAMHWAAAAGNLDVVRRLADAGGDVVGHGDDHELEVIGWATCWDGCDDDAHHAVVRFLLERGARHHIFSAIAMNDAEEVRRIVARDPSALNLRQSRNENNRTALHFAVDRDRPEMVSLLIDLGADPLAVDGDGMPVAAYATTPQADRPIMEKIRTMSANEIVSADRGRRHARSGTLDLLAVLSLGDWAAAERFLRDDPHLLEPGGAGFGTLHLAAKRNDSAAARWLLAHGADPSARWAHWDSDVTPLHLAVLANHPEMVTLLVNAGADPRIRDTKHDSDAIGWAEFFERPGLVEILNAQADS